MKKLLVTCALFCLTLPALAAENFSVLFKTQGTFEAVRDSVQAAIEGKGLKVNHVNYIAGMLERTGKDMGATRQVYAQGEQFEFCSATLSRAMMEADPHAIVMCPFNISVYTIPGDAQVYIAFIRPAAAENPALKKALADIEALLTEIIQDAL